MILPKVMVDSLQKDEDGIKDAVESEDSDSDDNDKKGQQLGLC